MDNKKDSLSTLFNKVNERQVNHHFDEKMTLLFQNEIKKQEKRKYLVQKSFSYFFSFLLVGSLIFIIKNTYLAETKFILNTLFAKFSTESLIALYESFDPSFLMIFLFAATSLLGLKAFKQDNQQNLQGAA